MSLAGGILAAVCGALILYVYAGYPVLLGLLARWRRAPGKQPEPGLRAATPPEPLPGVSLIVPAYNEEQVIARKIRNSLELDYPAGRLEIVVVSDGSSDATEETARRSAGGAVRLVFREDHEGKTACINAILPDLRGEIVAFTDANAFFRRDALRYLTAPFADPMVGCVMGELEYAREDSPNSRSGEGLYWRYENLLKERESRLGSTIVGNGAIYALRRELCRPLPREVEADVVNPLLALAAGRRVVFERRARCEEKAAATAREEFSRKTRIITNQITSYLFGWRELRPLPGTALFQILSHKLLRWLVPVFLGGVLAGSILMSGTAAGRWLLGAQAVFYLAAAAGWILETGGRKVPRVLFVPYYFCVVNAASLKGMADFLGGRRRVIWEKAPSTR